MNSPALPTAISPRVSVVIPVHNRAELALQTIASVQAQTALEWEGVVVNDRSQEEEWHRVENEIKNDRRWRTLSLPAGRQGACAARNFGAAQAEGAWILFLDSDDILGPHCLAQRLAVVEGSAELDFAVFQMRSFFDSVEEAGAVWNTARPEPDLARFLRGDTVWQTSGPIWRRASFLKLGGFDEALDCWQDSELHGRALATGLRYVRRFDLPADCFYRRHRHQTISQSGVLTSRYFWSQRRVLRKMRRHCAQRWQRRQQRVLLCQAVLTGLRVPMAASLLRTVGWAHRRAVLAAWQAFLLRAFVTLYLRDPKTRGLWRVRDALVNYVSRHNTILQCPA